MTSQLLLLAAFVVSMLLMAANHKRKRMKIVFFGDSITAQGILQGGYIKRMIKILQQEEIDHKYELAAAGVAGDKVYDLFLRMDEDILSKGADVVVIFIGVNDVWHKFSKLTGTNKTTFEGFYTAIINKLLSADIKVALCTLPVIGEKTNGSNEANEELDAYSDIVRSLAEKNQLPLIDIRKAFTSYLASHNINNEEQGILTTDRVHLNNNGNQLVAEEMWQVLQQVRL